MLRQKHPYLEEEGEDYRVNQNDSGSMICRIVETDRSNDKFQTA